MILSRYWFKGSPLHMSQVSYQHPVINFSLCPLQVGHLLQRWMIHTEFNLQHRISQKYKRYWLIKNSFITCHIFPHHTYSKFYHLSLIVNQVCHQVLASGQMTHFIFTRIQYMLFRHFCLFDFFFYQFPKLEIVINDVVYSI